MRLRRSKPDGPGIRRLRRGRGFSYVDASGQAVDPQTRERISSLAIPPAWQDVWISPWPHGHIQAVGTDDAGRRQYLYHEAWHESRNEAKHLRVLTLARGIHTVREAVETDLTARALGRDRVLGVALRMLDYGVFRTGGEAYVQEHGTHGVATLLREHVCLRRGEVVFEYTAKGGLQRSVSLRDDKLAAAIRALRRARCDSDRLLVYRDGREWREVHADDVNARFKELAGEDYTVKDLRTWRATVVAAVALAQAGPVGSKAARARAERAAMELVAEELGNTPAVARRSYVDPRVVEHFGAGRTIAAALQRLGGHDLMVPEVRQGVERAVVRLLASQPRG